MIDYARIASPLGEILAAAENGAIIGLWFEGQKYYPDIPQGWRENAASPPIARCAKRPFDFLARYGGEEFVLVLYGPPEDYARSLPEQIRCDVMDLLIPHAGSEAASYVSVSVGVALARAGSTRSLNGSIQTADEALYQAKREGRNRVVFKDTNDSEVETGNFRVVYRENG